MENELYHEMTLNDPQTTEKPYITPAFASLVLTVASLQVLNFEYMYTYYDSYQLLNQAALINAFIIGCFSSQIGQKQILFISLLIYCIFWSISFFYHPWSIIGLILLVLRTFKALIMIQIITIICRLWPGQYTRVVTYVLLCVLVIVILNFVSFKIDSSGITNMVLAAGLMLINLVLVARFIPNMGTIQKGSQILRDLLYGIFHYKCLLNTFTISIFLIIAYFSITVNGLLLAQQGYSAVNYASIIYAILVLIVIRDIRFNPSFILVFSFSAILIVMLFSLILNYWKNVIFISILNLILIWSCVAILLFFIPQIQQMLKSVNIKNLDLACSFYILLESVKLGYFSTIIHLYRQENESGQDTITKDINKLVFILAIVASVSLILFIYFTQGCRQLYADRRKVQHEDDIELQ